MYLIPFLSIAVQAGLIVHVIKTGRNMLWIWAIALLPLVGCIAYVVVEVLPEVLGGRTARRAKTSVRRMIDPDRELRRASAEVEISGNVDARRRLAEELFERGQYDAAGRAMLERLRHYNPDFKSADARYGLLLKRRGNLPAANRELKDLLDGAQLGPPHYRRAQAEWLERARRELS